MKTTSKLTPKTTDFAAYLSEFFKTFLPGQRDLSSNTITSYRDTFRFFLVFFEQERGKAAERLTLDDLTCEAVIGYLKWLKTARSNSNATRRQRLAAIHVFVNFVKKRAPQHLFEFTNILELKIKRIAQPTMKYISPDDMMALLHAPNVKERYG